MISGDLQNIDSLLQTGFLKRKLFADAGLMAVFQGIGCVLDPISAPVAGVISSPVFLVFVVNFFPLFLPDLMGKDFLLPLAVGLTAGFLAISKTGANDKISLAPTTPLFLSLHQGKRTEKAFFTLSKENNPLHQELAG